MHLYLLLQGRAGTYVNHIHDPVPLAAKLADLLVRDLDQQSDCVVRTGGLGVHRWM